MMTRKNASRLEKVKASVIAHKTPLMVVFMAMLYIGGSASGAVNFTDAGDTISAVSDDLIDPIANLVIGLIKLFVALFVIGMLGKIFNSVGGAVGQKI